MGLPDPDTGKRPRPVFPRNRGAITSTDAKIGRWTGNTLVLRIPATWVCIDVDDSTTAGGTSSGYRSSKQPTATT